MLSTLFDKIIFCSTELEQNPRRERKTTLLTPYENKLKMMKISVARIKEIKSGRISDPGNKGELWDGRGYAAGRTYREANCYLVPKTVSSAGIFKVWSIIL